MTYTLSNDLLTVSIQDAGAAPSGALGALSTCGRPTPPSGAGMPRCYSP